MGTSSGACAALLATQLFCCFSQRRLEPVSLPSSTNLHHTTHNTHIIATIRKRGHLALTVAMDRQSADGSTMNDPTTHLNEPLMEPTEWMHSGAPQDEHQSHTSSPWPPSTTFLGDPYRALTLLSSGGLRASDLLGRPIGRHPITGDLRLLPTQYRRANLSQYPWTSRQSSAHQNQGPHASAAEGGCRPQAAQGLRGCEPPPPTPSYSEWRDKVFDAMAAHGWGYVSGINIRSERQKTNNSAAQTMARARCARNEHSNRHAPPGTLSKIAKMLDHGGMKRRWSAVLPGDDCGDFARMDGHSEEYKPL
jgi:hypothetical protein